MDKFKQTFGLLLNQEWINDISWLVGISDRSEFTLERVKYIFLNLSLHITHSALQTSGIYLDKDGSIIVLIVENIVY